jgi:hypothetical protein
MKRIILALLLSIFLVTSAYAAGDVKVTMKILCDKQGASTNAIAIIWTFTAAAGVASGGSTSEILPQGVFGLIRGGEFVERSVTETFLLEIQDVAGRDVLQTGFVDPVVGAAADDDTHYRNIVDSTEGGRIMLRGQDLTLAVSSIGTTDSGIFILIIDLPYEISLP